MCKGCVNISYNITIWINTFHIMMTETVSILICLFNLISYLNYKCLFNCYFIYLVKFFRL